MSVQGAAPGTGIPGQRQDQGSGETIARPGTAGQPRPPRKIERVLAALIERPHTTRELEQPPVFDHVAHSTGADLRRRGIALRSERVEVRGFAGLPASIARYSIPPEGLEYARQVLAAMRARRGHGSQ